MASFDANTVSVIDTATNLVVATPVVTGSPNDVIVSPDGFRVYVPAYNANALRILDSTGDILGTVATGSFPAAVDYVRWRP